MEPLPRGYLALAELGTLPLIENGKELFKVAVRGFSSTLSSNTAISTIMKGYRANNESSDAIMAAVKELVDVNVDLIVPHFPALCHVLIGLFDVRSELALQVYNKFFVCLFRFLMVFAFFLFFFCSGVSSSFEHLCSCSCHGQTTFRHAKWVCVPVYRISFRASRASRLFHDHDAVYNVCDSGEEKRGRCKRALSSLFYVVDGV